jgi:hypothetical protein
MQPSFSSASPSSSSKALRALLALGLLTLSAGVGATACGGGATGGSGGSTSATSTATSGTGTGSTSTGADQCVGGVIIDGVCEGKCSPDKCLPMNTCVGNACELLCTSHSECQTGTQDCAAAKEDGTAKDVTVCTNTGRAATGTACPFGTECTMGMLMACPNGQACGPADAMQCGGQACTKDAMACGADMSCRKGLCPDKTPCTVPACPAAECRTLQCQTAGAADAHAYCTSTDCSADADCPGGFYCGIVRDPHTICNLMPAKGNNNLCGKTAEPCIDPATFGMDGASYFEGSRCILRKSCLKRDECAPCAGDIDCSFLQGSHCVTAGPDKRCLFDCKKNSDCTGEYHCVSGSCQQKYGQCTPKTKGEYCAACINDEDCGDKTGAWACEVTDSLSGERGCFDTSFSDACMADADCPKSPHGRNGHCLTEADGVSPGDSVYHKCYWPFIPDPGGGGKYSCEQ